MNKNELSAKLKVKGKERFLATKELLSFNNKNLITLEENENEQVLLSLRGHDNIVIATSKIDYHEIIQCAHYPTQLACLVANSLVSQLLEGEVYELSTYIDDCQSESAISFKDIEKECAESSHTLRADSILSSVERGVNVRLVGKSASGKTVSAAQVASNLMMQGWETIWIDLSNPNSNWMSFIVSLLYSNLENNLLLVIDDTQSNPSECYFIAKLVKVLSPIFKNKFCYIALTWESFSSICEENFPDSLVIPCFGEHVLDTILSDYKNKNIDECCYEEIKRKANGDLFIAKLQIDYLISDDKHLSVDELSEFAFKKLIGNFLLNDNSKKILYYLASLAQYEIDISTVYLSKIDYEQYILLSEQKIIRNNLGFASLGHRTLSKLLLHHFSLKWPELISTFPEPVSIAVDYIRSSPAKQLSTTLDRLDLISLVSNKRSSLGAKFLAKLWSSLKTIIELIASQSEDDPSWGDNTASAVFAGETLAAFDHKTWSLVEDYLHERWTISEFGFIDVNGESTCERTDFDKIKECMSEEDLTKNFKEWEEKYNDIDFDKMHRNWVLGLLIGFEAKSQNPDHMHIRNLYDCIKSRQESGGAYHPKRVPWVTARVLLGLAASGRTIHTCSTVKSSCDWLRRLFPDGPNQDGKWAGGTGSWNSTLGTTAMCISALLACGVSPSDSSIKNGINFLLNEKHNWLKNGAEIDSSFALSVILKSAKNWRDFEPELDYLVSWIEGKSAWVSAVVAKSDIKSESCTVAQVANSLLAIVWSIVRVELPLLLQDLSNNDTLNLNNIKLESKNKIIADFSNLIDLLRKNMSERIELIESNEDMFDTEINRKRIEIKNNIDSLKVEMKKIRTDIPEKDLKVSLALLNRIGKDNFPITWNIVSI